MQNGMVKNKLTYRLIEEKPDNKLLQEILVVYKAVFDDYKLDFFKNRIGEKKDVLMALCYAHAKLVGFKIGYRHNDTTFYSWVGGVLPEYRKQGIAKTLATLQKEHIVKKGYSRLRTKSTNKFKPMMILNLKNGFDIIQVYTNKSGQTKVVFEKDLNNSK